MPIQAEDSIVADSTLSTSPQQEDQSSVPIKRAARTYGRKRSPAPQEDASNSLEAPPYSSLYRTAPSNLTECIPPTSDNEERGHSDTDTAPDFPEAASKFQSDWRERLKKIDQAFEEDDDEIPSGLPPDGTPDAKPFGFGHPSLLLRDKDQSQSSSALDNDVFGGLVDRSRAAQSNPSSPEGAHSTRHKKSRTRIQDSDSEVEQPTTSPPVKTSPPVVPNFTPGSRQSSTSPTSDNGMATSRSEKGKLRSKQKSSLDNRRSVLPLEFVDSPSLLAERKDDKTKKTKPSRVTKKDRVERIKTSARLVDDRHVAVPRAETRSKHSKEAFWITVKNSASCPPSDPINSFSSPEARPISPGTRSQRTPSPLREPSAGPSRPKFPNVPEYLDSDEDLPPAIDVLNEFKKPNPPSKEKEKLNRFKKQMILKQTQHASGDEDSSSDLEIVPSTNQAAIQKLEAEHSRAPKQMTQTRKMQLQLAGISTVSKAPTSKKHKKQGTTRDQFNKQLLQIAREKAASISKDKEEEWKAIGGTVREPVMGEGSEVVVQKLAERGLEAAEATKEGVYGDSDEGSDEDWDPEEQGSGGPEPGDMEADEDTRDHDEDVPMADGMENEENESEDEEEVEEEVVKPRPNRRHNVVASDDDEENEENTPQPRPRQRRPLAAFQSDSLGDDDFEMDVAHDRPSPLIDAQNDDETDKENDTGLMFDRSDDKENKAVVRFGPLDFNENASPSLLQRDLSLSLDLSEPRQPFQEIPGLSDTPKPFELGGGNLTDLFEAQLSGLRRTPTASPGPSLQPIIRLGGSVKDIDGFSQFSDGENTLLGKSTSSSGDLSELFNATTQKLSASTWSLKEGSLGEAFFEKPLFGHGLHGLSKPDELDLTQDLIAARPLDIKGTQVRKADAVFEKEQEYLLGAAFEPKTKKEKLYVNDYGFLTQTRPNVEDPEVYEPPSPTQVQSQRATLTTPLNEQLFERSPLATLSLTDPTQFDLPAPLKRLRKRSASPSERVAASQGKARPNAFDALYGGSKQVERQKRRKLDARQYAAAEAEESDEEGGFWGIKKKGDDEEEEDGEDLDRTLETLVDDHEMDDETLAEDRVKEKFMEEEALTDQKIEAEAHAIAKGLRRTRKRNGDFMSDGSGDESDDDQNNHLRRRMARRIKKREDVEALEHNPQTKSFADTYKSTLVDDDNEFGHLAQDDTQAVLDGLTVAPGQDEDEDEESVRADDDETQPAAMGTSEFDRIVRERMANHGTLMAEEDEEEEMNLHDTSWVDRDEEPEILVKTIKPGVGKPHRPLQRPGGLDPSGLDDAFEDGNLIPTKRAERHQQQGQSWAKRESRNRNVATGRTVGAAAVTGLTRAKTGGGSLRQLAQISTTGPTGNAKPAVKKSESVLISRLGDKSARFTS